MKVFTYWETETATTAIPPYVLLGLTSMARALGSNFKILTRQTAERYVATEYLEHSWRFSHQSGHLSSDVMSIVARSDFLRMHVVAEHGGAWIDADTIVLQDFASYLDKNVGNKVLWHSEQFFAAHSGTELLRTTAHNMLQAERLVWGNPGGIKTKIESNKSIVDPVPMAFYDSGTQPAFNARNFDMMFRTDLAAEEFLCNDRQYIQKMYNSAFIKVIPRDQSVADFLDGDTLLSKIFLSLEDRAYWLTESTRVHDQITHKV